MTTVVTGATGAVGRAVVEQLAGAGEAVRATSRHPAPDLPAGATAFRADLLEPESLVPALRGARRLFLFPVPQTARRVVELARAAGVERIVVLSSGAVTGGYDTTFHPPVERAAEESGAEWTHVRPGEFAINKLRMWGPSIRAERVVLDPFPEQTGVPIHEADVAAVAVTALLRDGHAGAAYTVTGPAPVTNRAAVAAISAAIGAPVAIRAVTREEALEHYRRQGGWAAFNAEFLLGFQTYDGAATGSAPADGVAETAPPAPPSPSVEALIGRPARTFAEWARDHAHDFS